MKLTGLLGGSFNPAHGAHRAVTLFAIEALELDEAWWLVSPGNPLKPAIGMAPLHARFGSARDMARRAPIRVTAIERELGTRFTIDTLRALKRHYPRLRFVWLMGSDNLAQFHRWKDWRRIASEVPIAVIDRPPQSFRALAAPAAQALARYRLPENQAARLAEQRPPAWAFLTGMKLTLSSTGLRNSDGSWRTK